jgi:hypothetical protein
VGELAMSGKHEKNITELEAAIARMKADLARNTVPEDARKGLERELEILMKRYSALRRASN